MALLVIPIMAGWVALRAWVLMLLLGALHSLTDWPTAIGFWACVVISVLLGFITGDKATVERS